MPRHYRQTKSSSYWCFTINNPTLEDDAQLNFELWPTKPTFAIYNLETGSIQETMHYQGYLELPHHKTIQWMKQRLPRAHLEARKGSREQAIIYCLKELENSSTTGTDGQTETDTAYHGTNTLPLYADSLQTTLDVDSYLQQITAIWPILYNYSKSWQDLKKECEKILMSKMTRNQAITKMMELIDQGATELELAKIHPATWVSCNRALEKYRMLSTPQRDFKPRVIVCQGPTGTGKSKWCKEQYPKAYWKQRSNWWDGYTNQETVIIDEFYGWLPFDLCLKICDRYPLLVESKGGNINFVGRTIVFTTNNLPTTWWKNCYFQSFARRVDEWHIFPVWGMHIFFYTYEEALPHMFRNE